MQFENISLDQRNVLELHFLLNLINRYKWNIDFIILILIIIIVNVYYKFKIFETIVQTMINYKCYLYMLSIKIQFNYSWFEMDDSPRASCSDIY